MDDREKTLRAFMTVPGVGRSIAGDLYRLGLRSLDEIAAADPEGLYARFCRMEGKPVDRCLLYVFRCAVHFCSAAAPEPELCKWWNWTDVRMAARGSAEDGGRGQGMRS